MIGLAKLLRKTFLDLGRHDLHFHNQERWLGAKAGWTGGDEDNEADPDSIDPFRLDAGNDTWGAGLCIIGTADTPIQAGYTTFDFRRLMIHATEANVAYRIRVAWGTGYAAGIAAGTYTEIEFVALANKADAGPADTVIPRLDAGTKVFAAAWARNTNTATIDFTIGVHEYVE